MSSIFGNSPECHAIIQFVRQLRPPQGVCEAHLHQAYKPCVIGAIPSQTYGNV